MAVSRVLVANRGEVAVRVLRSAREMGIGTVAIYSEDDEASLHVRLADCAVELTGMGVMPYLAQDQILGMARKFGCDAIHPGWGFLSENADFAEHCETEGIAFVGPSADVLRQLGDKTRARDLAAQLGVPTLRGSTSPVTLAEAQEFYRTLDGRSMIIKAVAGGGGRGMRIVDSFDSIESAYARCQSEAQRSFGNNAVYVEERMANARHVEVQIVGDGTGAVSHLWERDCTIQRRHQKLVEIAPCPVLPPETRDQITSSAVNLASRLKYRGLGTFEFLVDADGGARYAFIEANPRLQVEHTVTEEVLGLDLVKVQLQLAAGSSLTDLGLEQSNIPAPNGFSIQLRVNAERPQPNGLAIPSTGTLTEFVPPCGPGVRLDTFVYQGYEVTPSFDSLLAKLIVHEPSNFEWTVNKAEAALRDFSVNGVSTNISLLRNLIQHDSFRNSKANTVFVDEHSAELCS